MRIKLPLITCQCMELDENREVSYIDQSIPQTHVRLSKIALGYVCPMNNIKHSTTYVRC